MADALDFPVNSIAEKPSRELIRALLGHIWGIQALNAEKDVRLYEEYYSGCLKVVDHTLVSPQSHRDVVDLVAFLKINRHETLRNLKAAVLNAKPPWRLLKEQSDSAAYAAIELGMKLWLMVGPQNWQESGRLSNHVNGLFRRDTSNLSGPVWLTGRALYRIGGMEILWTSRLEDHLRYDPISSHLFVFRHASFLQHNIAGASDIFPPLLLRETSMTLAMLFPPTDFPKKRWDRRIRKRADIDVEENLACSAPRDLGEYHYWRERLQQLQDALDRSKPRKLRQWVHDRRDGNQQAMIWLTVAAVLLGLLFGLIQSVTGILQVINKQ